MLRNTHSFLLVALSMLLPVGSLVISGCSKGETPSEPSADAGGRMGGPGGRMGGPGGGKGGPILASATGAEIFGQKCQGCHGDKGQGGNGPSLMKASDESDEALYKIVHDGKGRMPAFGNQMTEAQVKEVIAYVKKFGA
jgi:hypothetical protein